MANYMSRGTFYFLVRKSAIFDKRKFLCNTIFLAGYCQAIATLHCIVAVSRQRPAPLVSNRPKCCSIHRTFVINYLISFVARFGEFELCNYQEVAIAHAVYNFPNLITY